MTPNGSGGQIFQYHHPDRLGTRLVTNAQDTTYFEQQTLPFGTALNESPPTGGTTDATNRRFTTYDRSLNTGLDYALNRHYDPQQGRFTQVDPIGMNSTSLENPQTLNLYAYCINDPVNYSDPSGLGFFSFLKKAFKWIGIALSIAIIVASIVGLAILAPALTAIGFSSFGSAVTAASITGLVTGGLGLASQIGPRPVRIIAGLALLGLNVYGTVRSLANSRGFGFGLQEPVFLPEDTIRTSTWARGPWWDRLFANPGLFSLTQTRSSSPSNAGEGQNSNPTNRRIGGCVASVVGRYLGREGLTFIKIGGVNGLIALGFFGGRFFLNHGLTGSLAPGTLAEKGVEMYTRADSVARGPAMIGSGVVAGIKLYPRLVRESFNNKKEALRAAEKCFD